MEDHELLNTYSYLMRIKENFEDIKNKKYNLENFTDFDSALKNKVKEQFDKNEYSEIEEEDKNKDNDKHKYLKEKIRFKSNTYWLYIIFFILIGLIILSLILRHFLYKPSPSNVVVQQQIPPINYDNNMQPQTNSSSITDWFKGFFQKKNEISQPQPQPQPQPQQVTVPIVGGSIKRKYKRRL